MIRPRAFGFVLLILAVVTPLPRIVAAQNGTAPKPANNTPETEKTTGANQVIAAGDLLDISIFGVPELAQEVRVAGDGSAQLSLLGNTQLGGLTEAQAAETIANQLRDRNFLVHPQVKVAIKESAIQGVTVLGEVQHPGVYQIGVSRTLLDVLSLAGGLTSTADPKITIKHRSGTESVITVSFKGDDARASLALNGEVYPGDLIVVPRAGIVYVLGEVGRPGGFVMQDNGKITLLQALAQAGSTLPTASSNNAVLLRKVDEKLTASKVHVDKIERGKEQDVELHPNDILFIPNDRLKSALRTSGSLAATAAAVSSVAIYGAAVH